MSKSVIERLKNVLNRLMGLVGGFVLLAMIVVIVPVVGWKLLVTPFL